MRKSMFQKATAFALLLALLLACLPVSFPVKAAEETALTVQDMLGENWIVSWNGGSLDPTAYLEIVEGGYHGNFALRFGHPTQATQLTLRYKLLKSELGVANTKGIDWSLTFAGKLEGAFSSNTYIGLINPVASPGGNNRKNLSLSSLTSEWTVLNPNKIYDNKLWCPSTYSYAMIELAIKLPAGNYFYLDDLRGCSRTSTSGASFGQMQWVNIVHNGSFEKWYGSYNATASYTQDSDFVNIVDGGYSGERSLRLGNASKATNYTLQMHMNVDVAGTYSVALWTKKEGTITSANIELINGLNGTGTVYSLADAGTDWTYIQHTQGLTDVAIDSGTLTASVHVQLPAGSYLYIDDVQIVRGYDVNMPNLLSDGGFEGGSCLHYYDTTWEDPVNELQKKIGKNWYVSWNGGPAADAEYVNIVEGGSHGKYSLRIGHPTENTEIALRYRLYKTDLGLTSTTGAGVGMKFAAKIEGTLKSSSYIAVINPIDPATGNNRCNLPAAQLAEIGSDWTVVNENKSGDILYLWSGEAHNRVNLEFSIKLDAGNYFYLDDLQGYSLTAVTESSSIGNMKGVNAVHNGSFERWDCTWNSCGEATNAEFAQLVEEGRNGNALRLGNAEKDTDYTLQLSLPAYLQDGYSFDLWAKAEGEITDAAFELFDGTTAGARRRYSLNDVGTDWTHIQHEYGVTDVWVESGTLLVQIYVYLPAGSYLYLDDIHIAKGMSGVYYNSYPNMLADGMFQGYALSLTQPEPPAAPEYATFVGAHKNPTGWYQTWAGQDQYDTRHITSNAHSGNYALVLSCVESNMDYTVAHKLPTLEADAQYTFEGWFKKAGNLGSVSLMYGSNFKSLKGEVTNKWTKFTGTFTANSGTVFSIYAGGEQGSQLLMDDLVIYKSDDETKTNLLENGNFESVSGAWDEQLKIDKVFPELPVSVQAQLRLPVGAERCGVIFSNYDGKTGYTVGINENGQPYVTAVIADGAVTEGVFDSVDVRTGEALTLLISNANGQLSCAVNGEVKQTLAVTVPADAALYKNAFAIAGDNTYDNVNYFTGALISLSVSGAEQIMASWNLEKLQSPFEIPDTTGNGYDIVYMGEWFDELPEALLDKYTYAFAAVGDTQYTNRGDTERDMDYLGNLYQWIIDNQEKYNIQAVMGMGDITDTKASLDDETTMTKTHLEWAHAVESIERLNNAGIPYTLVRGNHDFVTTSPAYTTSFYDDYMLELGYDTVIDGWYEEGGTMAAAYNTVTVGQTKWLILTLDYVYDAQDIAWASNVISAHPDHKVIVTTHSHLNWAGNWQSPDSARELASKDLWDMLLSQHENIELMLCGHEHSDTVLANQRDGKGQNVVTEMLIDTQTHDDQYYVRSGKAPYAVVTLMLFTEDGSEVMVANYATGKNKFYKAEGVKTFDLRDNNFGEDSSVEQWGLTLGQDIGAQFHLRIEDAIAEDENAQLKITIGSKAATYRAIPAANEAGLYVFNVNVAAAQMTEAITLQLVSGEKAGDEYTYSVRQYADYILKEKPEEFDEKTKNLVTAMLLYGGKAQTYFTYNTGNMADLDITPIASGTIPQTDGIDITDNASGLDVYSAALSLKSKVAIRYYFTATEDISLYTFTDGKGDPLTPKKSGELYYVQISSINPSDLDGEFAVQVTKADSQESLAVSYNALDYMARKYYSSTTAQDLKDLVQAMYDYHLAAKAYTAV